MNGHLFHEGQKVHGHGLPAAWDTDCRTGPGTVTLVHGEWVRVQWDHCTNEDDMRPEWLRELA